MVSDTQQGYALQIEFGGEAAKEEIRGFIKEHENDPAWAYEVHEARCALGEECGCR